MEKEIMEKTKQLINQKRVMTIAVSHKDLPWSSPVYFVFHNNAFYFFSNENSRHIIYAHEKNISASIFHDSDTMDQIFGFQMSGRLEKISKNPLYLQIVKKYVGKFNFLKQIFGPQIVDNKKFFLEKFKSHLYGFYPDQIFLSDNSNKSDKRSAIDLSIFLKPN